jgi:hypothetical protein
MNLDRGIRNIAAQNVTNLPERFYIDANPFESPSNIDHARIFWISFFSTIHPVLRSTSALEEIVQGTVFLNLSSLPLFRIMIFLPNVNAKWITPDQRA